MGNRLDPSREQGFTLIELLVVVGILGILAGLAIPQFAVWRARGFDARAQSDLRNAATAQEAYFADQQVYISCANKAACISAFPGITNFSEDTSLAFVAANPNTAFLGTSTSSLGSGIVYQWDSQNGGMQN